MACAGGEVHPVKIFGKISCGAKSKLHYWDKDEMTESVGVQPGDPPGRRQLGRQELSETTQHYLLRGQDVDSPVRQSHQTGMALNNDKRCAHKLHMTFQEDTMDQAGLDPTGNDTVSQDKVSDVQRNTAIGSDQYTPSYDMNTDLGNANLENSNHNDSCNNSPFSNGANESGFVDQSSTRSGSTSSYLMAGGIEGRRIDSGYHSVGGADQLLKSAEEEPRAPIARITEISLTPEKGSEAATPEFIFATFPAPSGVHTSDSPKESRVGQNELSASKKPKPDQLNLAEVNKASPEPTRGRGLVSSHDSLSPRRLRPRTVRRKHTVSGVTEEARAVLEQLLRRSYSQNDASPRSTLQNEYVGISEMTVIEEQPNQPTKEQDYSRRPPRSPRSPLNRNKSYSAAVGGPPLKSDSFDFTCDDDDLTSHSPVSKTNSIISGSSRSSSFKHRFAVRPLHTEDVEAALQGKHRKKTKLRRRPHRDSTGSSSSASDSDAFDPKSGARRKKSFLKRASERLRQSFRIKRDHSRDFDDFSDTERDKIQSKKRKPKKKTVSSPSQSFEARGEVIHTHVHRHIHQEENKVNNGTVIVLRTEDIDVVQDSKDDRHVEVKLRTKESWPKDKEKKSVWDNIIKKIRKGSHKLQRRSSSKGKEPHLQQRSKSADALQYVTVQQSDNTAETVSQGGDRRRRITTSFREIFGHRRKSDHAEGKGAERNSSSAVPGITRPVLPPLPHLPPPPGCNVSDGPDESGRHDLRQQMRLDGLIAAQPEVPPGVRDYEVDIDVDRYDRVVHTRDGDQVLPVGVEQHQSYMFPDSVDDVDFSLLPAGFRQVVEDHSNKPFEQRTETEKEELYEKIAEQLAMIADNYNFNSRYSSIPTTVPSSKTDSLFKPTSTPATAAVPPALGGECLETSVDPQSPVRPAVQLPVEPASGGNLAPPEVVVIPESPQPLPGSRSGSESPVVEGAVGGQAVADETLLSPTVSINHDARRAHSIERKIGAILRDKGDKHAENVPDLQPIVTEIVKGGSYNQFYQTLHANIGQEPGWQQLAVMFKLTQSAVQLVGMGTAAALHIKEMSLQYFEDKFASWLIEKGGWESMVSDTDLSSEVD